jgi:hypothetical protein|tara:strand:- start:694 stop:828 length:135 start_codon:yes stop_codon:yes gene_type:complete
MMSGISSAALNLGSSASNKKKIKGQVGGGSGNRQEKTKSKTDLN